MRKSKLLRAVGILSLVVLGHSVLFAQGTVPNLTWTASLSTVAGYNVYWSATAGGPYTKVNTALITTTSYRDTTHTSGFWVTTAVDSNGDESVISNQATVPNPPTGLKVVEGS